MFAGTAGADWEQWCVQKEKRAIHLPDRYGSSVEDEVEFSGRLSCCQQHSLQCPERAGAAGFHLSHPGTRLFE